MDVGRMSVRIEDDLQAKVGREDDMHGVVIIFWNRREVCRVMM